KCSRESCAICRTNPRMHRRVIPPTPREKNHDYNELARAVVVGNRASHGYWTGCLGHDLVQSSTTAGAARTRGLLVAVADVFGSVTHVASDRHFRVHSVGAE